MNQFLGILQALLPWLLIALAIFLLWKFAGGLFTNLGTGLGSALSGTVPAVAIVAVAIVALFAVIVIWQPTFFNTTAGTSGPWGPSRQVANAEADLTEIILEPSNDVKAWVSEAAKAKADAVASEHQLATAKNLAGKSAAEAERACYLPPKHPDRQVWDDNGVDPCERSTPAGIQATVKNVSKTTGEVGQNAGDALAKIDVAETKKSMSQPFGSPPKEAEDWVRPFYNLPAGVVAFVMLLIAVIVVTWLFKSLLGSFKRA